MTAYVLGVDVSLTATGVARYYQGGPCTTEAITSTGKRADSIEQRAFRIVDICRRLADHAPASFPPALAVIENPSFGSVGGSAWDRAGLWWQIVSRLVHRLDVPVALVAPATRAKWATGNGRADKAAVASALTRRYGVEFPSNDEADAGALALMGAHRLGWITAPAYSLQALEGCKSWPDLKEAA